MSEWDGVINGQFTEEGGEKFYDVEYEVVQQLVEHGFATPSPGDSGEGTVRTPAGEVYRLTDAGVDMLEREIRRVEQSNEQPIIRAGGETFYSAWEFGPDGTTTTYPAGRIVDEVLRKGEAENKWDVNGFLVKRLVDLGMAHDSPGDSGPGTVRNRETGQVYRLTEDGMNRMEDPTWRAATIIDNLSDDAKRDLDEASEEVGRLQRVERALRKHQADIEAGADRETAAKVALAGLGYEGDVPAERSAASVLEAMANSYTRTGKWPHYATWDGGDSMEVIGPGAPGTQDDLVESFRRNPVVDKDGEIWHDNGDGTYTAKREDGSEAIMDTAGGMAKGDLEAALAGRLSMDQLRAMSPAAAMTLGPMMAHNQLTKASPDNPMWGKDTLDLLMAVGHVDPRMDYDDILADMLLEHDVELVGYNSEDKSGASNDYRLTKQGARKAEDLVCAEYNIPPIPEHQARLLTIQPDGTTRMTAIDCVEDASTLKQLQEFIGGPLEAVYCFPPERQRGRDLLSSRGLRGSGRPDAVIYVHEEGLLENLPTNYKATDLAYEVGAQWGDVGRGLMGNVAVLALDVRDAKHLHEVEASGLGEWGRELPARILDWIKANEGVTSVAGVKECKTSVLRALSRNAAEERLEYLLDPRLDPLLDPNGIHVLRALVTLDRQGELPVDPYMRVEIQVKVRNSMEPVTQRFFDVRLKDYVALRTPPGAEPIGGARGTQRNVRAADMRSDERTPREQ